MFDMIKDYYERGLWDINRVWNVVGKANGINEDEYFRITGCLYPAKQAE